MRDGNMIKKVEIYGDSILKGIMLNKETGKYYFGTKDNIEKISNDFNVDIKNNAKFGCTITKGYHQLMKRLQSNTTCDAMILEYGGNDCDYDWAKIAATPNENFIPRTQINEFRQTYIKMIEALNSKNITPVLISLPPISAEKYINWICKDGINKESIMLWLKDVQRIYRVQELYSSEIDSIAKEYNCAFIDIRKEFLKKENLNNYLCEDGIHPNEQGHKIIANTIRNFMKKSNKFIHNEL